MIALFACVKSLNQPTGNSFSYIIKEVGYFMTYQDRVLNCKECGADFQFTASEQAFYAEKGFQNDPSRCPACRSARKQGGRRSDSGHNREMFNVTCSGCGQTTQVPFNPSAGRPVYCRNCFAANKRS
jgi:CxxC-x17-CxxC domain-containing protein